MCEKKAQQNLCEKGRVPEAQLILWYDICKKGTFVNNGVCFFMLRTPLKRMYSCEKGGFHRMLHMTTLVEKMPCWVGIGR